MTALEVTVAFADGVADLVETFDDLDRDLPIARRLVKILTTRFAVREAAFAVYCVENDRLEDLSACADCDRPLTCDEARTSLGTHDEALCDECIETRAVDAENECACGYFCDRCTGTSRAD